MCHKVTLRKIINPNRSIFSYLFYWYSTFLYFEYDSKFEHNFNSIIFNNYFIQVKISNIKIMHEIEITGNLFLCTKIMIKNYTVT